MLLSGVSNVSIDGNHFKRVTRDVLSLGTGCTNVAFRGNVMKDVCLANDVSTESQRYVVRINDPVDGLIISENMVDNPSMLRNPPMIGLATTSAAVSGLVVRDNILPDGISTHELTTAMRQAVTDTSRAVLAYDGDGTASQTLTLRFAPVFVMVSITTGTDRGRSMSVSAMASAGSDLVEISGRDVIVKGPGTQPPPATRCSPSPDLCSAGRSGRTAGAGGPFKPAGTGFAAYRACEAGHFRATCLPPVSWSLTACEHASSRTRRLPAAARQRPPATKSRPPRRAGAAAVNRPCETVLMQITETNAEGLKREYKVVVPATSINEKIDSRSPRSAPPSRCLASVPARSRRRWSSSAMAPR
ncbi:hypothetical protein ACFQ4K_26500 [Tistrella bauzanensis]